MLTQWRSWGGGRAACRLGKVDIQPDGQLRRLEHRERDTRKLRHEKLLRRTPHVVEMRHRVAAWQGSRCEARAERESIVRVGEYIVMRTPALSMTTVAPSMAASMSA